MLTYQQVLQLHQAAIREFGGSNGIRGQGLILSAIAQPHQSFGGVDLYPTPIAKAAILGWSLTKNHGFVDGNKRVGWLATKVALFELGYYLNCSADEGEEIMLGVAAGEFEVADFTLWIESMIVPVAADSAEELNQSLLRFGMLLNAKLPAVNDYKKALSINTKRADIMILIPSTVTKASQRRLQEDVRLSADSLTLVLLGDIDVLQMEVETIRRCVPHCLNWFYITAVEQREEALNYVREIGKTISSTDEFLENIQDFQVSTKSLQKTSNHPTLIEALDSLSNAFDDLTFLFNQNWFSFKEMFDIAKKKLNES